MDKKILGVVENWSANTLKSNIINYKRQAQASTRNPKTNFDNTIKTNLMCNGKMPGLFLGINRVGVILLL